MSRFTIKILGGPIFHTNSRATADGYIAARKAQGVDTHLTESKNATHYFCSFGGVVDRIPFSRWHAAEIEGRSARTSDRDKPRALTRADALELVNRWNGAAARTGGAQYYI